MKDQSQYLTCNRQHHHCHKNWQIPGQPGYDIYISYNFILFSCDTISLVGIVTIENCLQLKQGDSTLSTFLTSCLEWSKQSAHVDSPQPHVVPKNKDYEYCCNTEAKLSQNHIFSISAGTFSFTATLAALYWLNQHRPRSWQFLLFVTALQRRGQPSQLRPKSTHLSMPKEL